MTEIPDGTPIPNWFRCDICKTLHAGKDSGEGLACGLKKKWADKSLAGSPEGDEVCPGVMRQAYIEDVANADA